MRMWMVNPKIMCRQHLLGEHLELHMFIGHLKRDTSLDGYIQANLLEPSSIKPRHDELVEEMTRRGYSHNSPIPTLPEMLESYKTAVINKKDAYGELLSRCVECRCRAYELEYGALAYASNPSSTFRVPDLKKAISRAAEIAEGFTNQQIQAGDAITDYANRAKAVEMAIKEVQLPEELHVPIYLLLTCAWNDILDWTVTLETNNAP